MTTANPTTVLTGATGFVGPYLQAIRPCVPLVDAQGQPIDVRDASALNSWFEGVEVDAVIHLAAQSFVPRSFADPQETFEINFVGTLNLLNALKRSGFRGRFLYVGTADIYGAVPVHELPITESQLPHPRNPYAVSKLAAEALCYQWSQTEPFQIVMARPFNHIGPRQPDHFVVSSFAKQIADRSRSGSREPIKVGDVDVTRDFSDVRDIVRAYDMLVDSGLSGEIYNICSGVETSLREVLQVLQRLAGTEVDIIQESSRLRPSEQRRVAGNFGKIHKRLGWEPTIPLQQSLGDILDFWNSQL